MTFHYILHLVNLFNYMVVWFWHQYDILISMPHQLHNITTWCQLLQIYDCDIHNFIIII
jgi:hypothetical protein